MERKVFIPVRDGDAVKHVQVGIAVEVPGGFAVQLGELVIGGAAAPAKPRASGSPPTVFPNYGRSKGAPIAGASREDLEYYASGAKRTLADPAKSRWHDNERALLAAIEAELAKDAAPVEPRPSQGSFADPPPPGDDDIPF